VVDPRTLRPDSTPHHPSGPRTTFRNGFARRKVGRFRKPTGAQGLGTRFMFNPPPPQPTETSTPDLPKAVAWAALRAAYSPEQLGLMQVHEHMSERELNAALRSRFVPPTGLRLS
jgi:hypothetical protein